jgi:predicted Ser/Thr protein kinase
MNLEKVLCEKCKKNPTMKRARSQNCHVAKDCLVQCLSESGEWHMPSETPLDLQNEQHRCEEKRQDEFISLQDSDEEEFDEEELAIMPENRQAQSTTCRTNKTTEKLIRNSGAILLALKQTLHENEIGFLHVLGEGSFGMVVSICAKLHRYAVKIETGFDENVEFKREFQMQTTFYEFGLAPRALVFIDETFQHPAMIVMNELDGTLVQWLQERQHTKEELDVVVRELVRILFGLSRANLMHRDLHFGNIGYIIDPFNQNAMRLVLIDFGRAQKGSDPELELVFMICSGVLYNEYIASQLIALYKTNFGEPPASWIDKRYELLEVSTPVSCEKMTLACSGKLRNMKLAQECLVFCKDHAVKVLHEFVFFMMDNQMYLLQSSGSNIPLPRPVIFLTDMRSQTIRVEQRTSNGKLYVDNTASPESLSAFLGDWVAQVRIVFPFHQKLKDADEMFTIVGENRIFVERDKVNELSVTLRLHT